LARLVGLREDLVRVREDLALGLHDVVGHVFPADPLRSRRRDVHRDLPGDVARAATNLHEHTELVRRWVGVPLDQPSVDRLEACGARDDDVLAELAGEHPPLFVEALGSVGTVRLDGLEHLLRERKELVVVRYRLGLAADRDQGPELALVGHAVADLALGRHPARALLRARHAALAQEPLGGFDVAVRVLQRALAVHHRSLGLVAKLLDECRADAGHSAGTSSGFASAAGAASATGSSSGATSSESPSATDACSSAGAAAPFFAGVKSAGVAFCCPAAMPSAITRTIRSQDRMA